MRAPSRTLHQEIFENEHTLTTLQGTAATHAFYPTIRRRVRRGFDPNNFVLCPAVGTLNDADCGLGMRLPKSRSVFDRKQPPNRRGRPEIKARSLIQLRKRNLEMELQKQGPNCSKFRHGGAAGLSDPKRSQLELTPRKRSGCGQQHHEQKPDGDIIRNGHGIVSNMSIPSPE